MGTYLITGASSGIGAAVAEALDGHELILAGRSAERLRGKNAVRTIEIDLAEPSALASAPLPDHLDGLVHCAGVVDLGRIEEMSVAQWQEQLTVNLVAAAELTRLLLPALRAAKGRVVFVNSGAGLRANPGWGAYAASKHGLRALADALRAEEPALAVTTVYPGRTATAMQQRVRAQEQGEYDPEDYIQPTTVAQVIMNALATPRDAVLTEVTVRPAPR